MVEKNVVVMGDDLFSKFQEVVKQENATETHPSNLLSFLLF